MTLADRIVVLRGGVIEQIGSHAELYGRPANTFVAGFIGSPTMNFVPARLHGENGGLAILPRGGTPLTVPPAVAPRYEKHAGKDVIFGIRPEHLTNAWTDQDRAALSPVSVKVEIAEPLGADTLIFSKLGDTEVVCRTSPEAAAAPGATIRLQANMNHMHLFDPERGVALRDG